MNSTAVNSLPICDLLITNGHILTLDRDQRSFRSGSVAIRGSTIVDVGATPYVDARWTARRQIDAQGGIVHPGLIEPHNHVNLSFVRSILTALRANPGNKVAQSDIRAALTGEEERISAQLAMVEMLRYGFTGFIEPGTFFDTTALAEESDRLGMRVWLSGAYAWDDERPVIALGQGSPAIVGRAPLGRAESLIRLTRVLDEHPNGSGLAEGYVALYGEGTASDELLQDALALARKRGVALQTHTNFLPASIKAQKVQWGCAPVERLARIGLLAPEVMLVHLNCLTDAETEVLAAARCNLVWCPGNAMRHGLGLEDRSRVPGLRRRGCSVTIGTDMSMDWSSGDTALIAYLAARNLGDALSDEDLLAMQTSAPAGMLGRGDRLGSLEVGKLADVVVRPSNVPGLRPRLNPIHELALLGRDAAPSHVIVNGTEVVRDGQVLGIDVTALCDRAEHAASMFLARVGIEFVSR